MFSHATFHSGHLSGKARQEVILRSSIVKNRNRRQNAKSIGCQKQHVLGMASLRGWTNNIVNVIDRVGNAGVGGQAGIAEIDLAISIHHHIFQQRIAADCPIDFWLAGLA